MDSLRLSFLEKESIKQKIFLEIERLQKNEAYYAARPLYEARLEEVRNRLNYLANRLKLLEEF